jgi:hypothetical protein
MVVVDGWDDSSLFFVVNEERWVQKGITLYYIAWICGCILNVRARLDETRLLSWLGCLSRFSHADGLTALDRHASSKFQKKERSRIESEHQCY